jgi:hypothetical protein
MLMMWIYWVINTDTIKKSTQTLLDTSKVVGLEVSAEKTKYVLLSRHQNAGQNHEIKTANRCFENVVQFRYLGVTITNQNLIQEEIKRRLHSGNACYHAVKNLLSSRFLSKNIKIRIYKTIILPVVLDGCETCRTVASNSYPEDGGSSFLRNVPYSKF